MKFNGLGNSGLRVSEICLGTMTWGEQNTESEAHAQLDLALSRGVNFIDAAEMYPVPPRAETQGRTESYLGSWLRRQQRDKVVVATKITAPGRGFAWVRSGPTAIDRNSVRDAVELSLRRLQTDYIDLYQIHWPDRYVPSFGSWAYDPSQERPSTPIEAQLEALDEVVKAGKVRCVGVSNETPWGVCEFVAVAQRRGLARIASIQNAYNLLNRTFEMGLAEVHRQLNVPLLAYSPLGFGHLTGKYLDGAKPEGADSPAFRLSGNAMPRSTFLKPSLTMRGSPGRPACRRQRWRWPLSAAVGSPPAPSSAPPLLANSRRTSTVLRWC